MPVTRKINQLWANLPADRKMMPPRYRGITTDQIPQAILSNGIQVKVIAGIFEGIKGPVDDIFIHPEYFDCTVPAGQTFVHQTVQDFTAFIFIIFKKHLNKCYKKESKQHQW